MHSYIRKIGLADLQEVSLQTNWSGPVLQRKVQMYFLRRSQEASTRMNPFI
jgi:hypothetical protein